ncbi:hypothetical protein QWY77_00880 [Thalassotalea ponticola]|uniref:hypothetical protein n=1 Tax=Thalassotalea ponticola TaxID=1523392 RepID=UPI0025B3A69E|nr:hypothetical protein [Thalassotalea ponticola]MDN3651339.1 hypothetical protein [Thalassotalea ponticola]
MAVQALPIIKAIAPYLADIASATIPAFTSKSKSSKEAAELINEQISELQSAASQNAQNLNLLADNLQKAILSLEESLVALEKKMRIYLGLTISSILISITALVVASLSV